MKQFKGPAKQLGFAWLPFVAKAAGGLLGMLGSSTKAGVHAQTRDDILGMPGMEGASPISGNFGRTTAAGRFTGSNAFQQGQNELSQMGSFFGNGGLFNDPSLQAAFDQNDISGALGQAQQGFSQQAGNSAFGGLGLLNSQLQNSLGQDFSGGRQESLFNQGMANQNAASDQSALFNQSLNTQRLAAQPEFARQQQAVEQSLFNKGMFGEGTSNTGEAFRGMFEAQNAADLGFQNNAFSQAAQQQQLLGSLGGQQMGQGMGFLGQNIGQMNTNIGQQIGIEGQQFGQNLQGLGFNAQQGQNQLGAAHGMFQMGADAMHQGANIGLGAQNAQLGFNQFGLNAAAMPAQLRASLIGASGHHASALAGGTEANANAQGGLFSGLGKAIGGLFSDARLKENIRFEGRTDAGLGLYSWDWNDTAKELGIDRQPEGGVMAQEVMETRPDAVSVADNGYLIVDYDKLAGE